MTLTRLQLEALIEALHQELHTEIAVSNALRDQLREALALRDALQGENLRLIGLVLEASAQYEKLCSYVRTLRAWLNAGKG